MARVRALGWFFDGGLVGAFCWLIAISTFAAIVATGMLRTTNDPMGVVPEPSFLQPLNFSRGIELEVRPDLGPFGIEIRKIGREERVIFYGETR